MIQNLGSYKNPWTVKATIFLSNKPTKILVQDKVNYANGSATFDQLIIADITSNVIIQFSLLPATT